MWGEIVTWSSEIGKVAELCKQAGDAILRFHRLGVDVEHKADDSPVTEADRAAEEIILAGLGEIFSGVPVVAEEAVAGGDVPRIGGRFLLVDPLDGTREFISGRRDFTVNVALVEDGEPVLGVVLAPARQVLYAGERESGAALAEIVEGRIGAWKPIQVREAAEVPPVAVASRSHGDAKTEDLLTRLSVGERISVGSSLKFCMVACGEADFYPRFGRTMEWDTAAGQAVLSAAGGLVTHLDGTPFGYGKTDQADDVDFANPGFFAAGNRDLISRAVMQG
ncbi:3'(2'),5'-bisphosphate nucleotidase CysQ [Stappia taiwanensis]|uniref:3'(2'),5'-bisphosphate nucleotidase CysQ n=1 Tax=Stappia taiwanensis TaxID=992267 RepID=A0A838XM13_9HYPH|nr:3'(2'),5'-bisphosphate nucleotidase CysQ [Stappia taiwanensis]